MRIIEHWDGIGTLSVAESVGGVLATLDPVDNVVRAGVRPWPSPELIQKMYASERWRGKSELDTQAVASRLGHYTDLQSLNSEDAITWSFFGPLIYGSETQRLQFGTALMSLISLPAPAEVGIWLWRRIPHPEKLASNGGPEIDFGVMTESVVVLGEAKWNSGISKGQGVAGNRSQLDLRASFCSNFGPKAARVSKTWVVLGVGRSADVLGIAEAGPAPIFNLTWAGLAALMPKELQPELAAYLTWKEKYSSVRSGTNSAQTA